MAELREKSFVVKYRYCNIPEKLEMLQAIGMTPGSTDINYDYSVFAKGISYIGFLMQEVSVKTDSGVLNSWDELLEDEDQMPNVIKIFTDILNPPKKKKAKKQ